MEIRDNSFPDIDDLENTPAPKKRKSKKIDVPSKKYIVVAVVVVLVIVGAVGYMALTKKAVKPPVAATTATAVKVAPTAVKASPTTQQYVSTETNLNLSFSYPSDWSVSPSSTTSSSNQPIILTSPLTSMTSYSGSNVTGKVVISISNDMTQLAAVTAGTAIAAQNSAQMAFSTPTTSQYQYPYLTYASLPGSPAASGAFQAVIITGPTQFTTSQPVSTDSLSGVSPIIAASFYQCNSATCTSSDAVPMGITNATWNTGAIFLDTLNVFKSMKLN